MSLSLNVLAREQLSAGDVIGGCFLVVVGIIFFFVIVAKVREWVAPREIGNRMRRFFGPEMRVLQAHEKSYPGWDLGSLSKAVASFVEECCEGSQRLGSVAGVSSVQRLIPMEKDNYEAKLKPSALTYERLPVDVEREESFVSNVLYFATVRAEVLSKG